MERPQKPFVVYMMRLAAARIHYGFCSKTRLSRADLLETKEYHTEANMKDH